MKSKPDPIVVCPDCKLAHFASEGCERCAELRAILVACPHCRGTGKVEITGVYAETLRLLVDNGGRNGADLAKLAGCKATAMNMRLKALERRGLAVGLRFGRETVWTSCPPPANHYTRLTRSEGK